MANAENLVPFKKGHLNHEEAVRLGSKGGKKSVEVRREKKLLSQLYAEFLAKEHNVTIHSKKGNISGEALISSIIVDILLQCNSGSVSMLKEIREATEGNGVFALNSNKTQEAIPPKITFTIIGCEKQAISENETPQMSA